MRHVNPHVSSAPASVALALVCLLAAGCATIQSDAVRELIDEEGRHIDEARKNSGAFVADTGKMTEALKSAVAALNASTEAKSRVDAVQHLVFSSNKAVANLTGTDAEAVAYLVGDLYLSKSAGLEQAVKDQFDEDFRALGQLAQRIQKSWAELKRSHGTVSDFAHGTFLAGIDAAALKALVIEAGGDIDGIDDVLKRSKQVNQALKRASGAGLISDAGAAEAQTYTRDLMDLLERVKQQP